jgi:hypothetical protein
MGGHEEGSSIWGRGMSVTAFFKGANRRSTSLFEASVPSRRACARISGGNHQLGDARALSMSARRSRCRHVLPKSWLGMGWHQRKGRGCWIEGTVAGTDDACAADDSTPGGGGLRGGKGTDRD